MAVKTSKALEQFNELPWRKQLELCRAVFNVLEYDTEGNPGNAWSSDTTQALGETFERFGVTFTPPEA